MRLLPYTLALLGILLIGYSTLASGHAHAPDTVARIGANIVPALQCAEDDVIAFDTSVSAPYPLACVHIDTLRTENTHSAPDTRTRYNARSCALAARAVRFQLLELATSAPDTSTSTGHILAFALAQSNALAPCGAPID